MAYMGPQKWADDVKDWLLSPKDKAGTDFVQLLYATPLGKTYIDWLYSKRDTETYLERYGLEYTDIYDFRKLPSTGPAAVLYGKSLNYVSRNIGRMYR